MNELDHQRVSLNKPLQIGLAVLVFSCIALIWICVSQPPGYYR